MSRHRDERPENDVMAVLEAWLQTRLTDLRGEAEAIAAQFWAQAATERGRRPKKEWGRLGVRVRLQRTARAQPGAFAIEWFLCRWANRRGGTSIHTAYLRRGAGLRYPRTAFHNVTQPWEQALAESLEHRFGDIRQLARSLSQLGRQFRQHRRLERRLANRTADSGEGA